MKIDKYADSFPALEFSMPADRVLEITLYAEGKLNAADADMHRDLAYVWRDIDLDDSVNAVLVKGSGKGFSAGGDFELIESMIEDDDTLVRVWQEARHLV